VLRFAALEFACPGVDPLTELGLQFLGRDEAVARPQRALVADLALELDQEPVGAGSAQGDGRSN
jgi:hypothetical protein